MSDTTTIIRLCRERAAQYGAMRGSSLTAIALDRAADALENVLRSPARSAELTEGRETMAAEAILKDIRGRRLLKYIFEEDPSNVGAWGRLDAPIDVETQKECALTWARFSLAFAAGPIARAAAADESEAARLRRKLWMVACHATGGGIPEIEGIDRSVNDICVQITANRNMIYQAGKDAALAASSRLHLNGGATA